MSRSYDDNLELIKTIHLYTWMNPKADLVGVRKIIERSYPELADGVYKFESTKRAD